MTLLRGSASGEIDAPLGDCWSVVEDVAAAPEWQQGLERVDVVERDDQGRPRLCDTVSDAKFTKVRCRVEIVYDGPHRLQIRRVESEDVDAMEMTWELAEITPGRTRATFTLGVDPGPVGLLARPLERALRPVLVGGRPRELARAVAQRVG